MTVLFGIKPSGNIHLGNLYCIQQALKFAQEKDTYVQFLIADLHALTTLDNKHITLYIRQIIAMLIYLGVDKKHIYIQSKTTEIYKTYFLLNPFVNLGTLNRMHLVKQLKQNSKQINMLQYSYPLLMAIDIFASSADYVVIGKDQKQHIEFYFYIKHKLEVFNSNISFTNIQPLFTSTLPGIDDRKMSKSYDNYISVFSDEDHIRNRINKIKTIDKKYIDINDYSNNVTEMLSIFEPVENIKQRYETNNNSFTQEKAILTQFCLKMKQDVSNFMYDEYMDEIVSNTVNDRIRVLNELLTVNLLGKLI